jgi:signal transduction histidine kinase
MTAGATAAPADPDADADADAATDADDAAAAIAGRPARPGGVRGDEQGARPSLRRRIRVLFAGVIALALAAIVVGALVFVSLLDARLVLVDRIDESRLQAQVLLAAMIDQETGVRGYVLSGDPAFLEPYERGTATEARVAARLERLVADVPGARDDLDAARAAAAAWHEGYARPAIAGLRAGDGAVRDPAAVEDGRRRFIAVRDAHARFDAVIESARDDARDALDQRTRALVAVMALGLAITLGGVIALWRLYRRSVEDPLHELGEDARRVAGGQLDHHVRPTGPAELAELAEAVELMRTRIVEELQASTEAHAALELQAAELSRSNAELEQFAYVASHDLQEPLRKVASFCQLLQTRYRGQLDERADQYIDFAVDGAKRMQLLINDLLAFSRVGRLSGPLEPLDGDEALARALDNLSTALEEAGAEVVADDLPVVDGDRSLLTALFQNLIGNAVKFRRPDAAPRVAITVEDAPDEDAWLISVADNGIGIEPEYAERVFVIFQRLHAKERYAGTGIGLALCRKIVDHHGGRIWVDTSVPDGTTIRFTLPRPEGAPE